VPQLFVAGGARSKTLPSCLSFLRWVHGPRWLAGRACVEKPAAKAEGGIGTLVVRFRMVALAGALPVAQNVKRRFRRGRHPTRRPRVFVAAPGSGGDQVRPAARRADCRLVSYQSPEDIRAIRTRVLSNGSPSFLIRKSHSPWGSGGHAFESGPENEKALFSGPRAKKGPRFQTISPLLSRRPSSTGRDSQREGNRRTSFADVRRKAAKR